MAARGSGFKSGGGAMKIFEVQRVGIEKKIVKNCMYDPHSAEVHLRAGKGIIAQSVKILFFKLAKMTTYQVWQLKNSSSIKSWTTYMTIAHNLVDFLLLQS